MRFAMLVVVAACVAGCSHHLTEVCPSDLIVVTVPTDTTISVGQSFIPSITLLGCHGTQVLHDVITLLPADTSVVAVDSATLRITAKKIGQTKVFANTKTLGTVAGLTVIVTAK
ncbi:MAG TPA: hypothetical protein VIJ16_03745 [Gemmatimonadaceae bacterium]